MLKRWQCAYSASFGLPAYIWHLVSSLVESANEQRTVHEVVQLFLGPSRQLMLVNWDIVPN